MAADAKTRILDAARAICLEDGPGALTMRGVGDRVGITAPAIYRHYPSKAHLLQELVDEANRVFRRYLVPALDGATPRARLEAIMEQYLEFGLEQNAYYEVLFFSRERRDLDPLPDRTTSPNFILLVDRAREAAESGVLRAEHPVSAAITCWALGHGLMALYRTGRFGEDKEAFRREYRASFQRLFDGLVRRESGGC